MYHKTHDNNGGLLFYYRIFLKINYYNGDSFMKRNTFSLFLFTFFCGMMLSISLFTGCFGDDEKETTTSGDTTAPQVFSSVPNSGDIANYNFLQITITFDEPMDPGSISVNTTGITCNGNTIEISSVSDNFNGDTCYLFLDDLTPSADNKIFTATINGNLLASTLYFLRVGTAAKDAAGNHLESEYKIQFTSSAK